MFKRLTNSIQCLPLAAVCALSGQQALAHPSLVPHEHPVSMTDNTLLSMAGVVLAALVVTYAVTKIYRHVTANRTQN